MSATAPDGSTKVPWPIIIGIIALLCIAIKVNMDRDDRAKSEGGAQAGAETVYVTMVELEKRIEENEVGAMVDFQGKILVIEGMVDSVTLDGDDRAILAMNGSGLLPVRVPLPESDKALAGRLKIGQVATVTCSSIKEAGAKPVLDQCVLSLTGVPDRQ